MPYTALERVKLVAKGLARRLGRDIRLVGSEISGPNKGSEFEIRVPLGLSYSVINLAGELKYPAMSQRDILPC